jgi:hypothetical protein
MITPFEHYFSQVFFFFDKARKSINVRRGLNQIQEMFKTSTIKRDGKTEKDLPKPTRWE